MSDFYRQAHESRGVTVRLDSQVAALKPKSGLFGRGKTVTGVELSSGETIACDSALVGIGVIPNQEFAAESGLETGNGILIDEACRTSDPVIFAIGDCAEQHNWLAGKRLRLESVPNALDQAKRAAAAICGSPAPKPEVPWFWSDQYDLKLQTAGLIGDHDSTIIRAGSDETPRSFFHLASGVLIAADCINDPQSFMAAKMMIADSVIIAPLSNDVTVGQ